MGYVVSFTVTAHALLAQVLQMVGRAGRPQFDQEGVAVIMTSRDSTHRYQRLLAGQVRVRSHWVLQQQQHAPQPGSPRVVLRCAPCRHMHSLSLNQASI
jgi:hypothetical protein